MKTMTRLGKGVIGAVVSVGPLALHRIRLIFMMMAARTTITVTVVMEHWF